MSNGKEIEYVKMNQFSCPKILKIFQIFRKISRMSIFNTCGAVLQIQCIFRLKEFATFNLIKNLNKIPFDPEGTSGEGMKIANFENQL